jgi:site-specific DNA-methyltransferase (adenine-specific)
MEYLTWLHKVIEVSSSKLRPGGAFWLHLPDALVVHGYMALRFCGLVPVNWVILHQEFGQYTDLRFIPSKVHGLYFVRPGGLRVWNVREALEPSLRARIGDKRVRTARFRGSRPWLDVWYGENLGRVQGNNAERWRNHPNQLPELYLARIIRATTRVGDRILDPCLGSGTTAVVGAALWRPVWGVEKNGALCRSAVARIKRGCVRDVGGSLSSGRLLD